MDARRPHAGRMTRATEQVVVLFFLFRFSKLKRELLLLNPCTVGLNQSIHHRRTRIIIINQENEAMTPATGRDSCVGVVMIGLAGRPENHSAVRACVRVGSHEGRRCGVRRDARARGKHNGKYSYVRVLLAGGFSGCERARSGPRGAEGWG